MAEIPHPLVSRVLGAIQANHTVSPVRKNKIRLETLEDYDEEAPSFDGYVIDGSCLPYMDTSFYAVDSPVRRHYDDDDDDDGDTDTLRTSISSSSLKDMLMTTERIVLNTADASKMVIEAVLSIPAGDSKGNFLISSLYYT
eukprot:m.172497 g.172497  ORF g.172497 m.172497 type:complete len:141 (+) comp39084_c0_seq55:5476-5898(+)